MGLVRPVVPLVRPYLNYAASDWKPNFKKDRTHWKGTQPRATKLVKELKSLSYEERLMKLSLMALEERRIRGDLKEMYKIIHEIENINLINGFKFRDNNFNPKRHFSLIVLD